jgi:Cu+-exporting ATPase
MSVPQAGIIDLAISGMTCASCSTRLERVLNQTPGVSRAQVNLASEKARIETNEGGPNLSDLVAVVQRAGFEAAPLATTAERRAIEKAEIAKRVAGEERLLALSLFLSLPLTLPMIFMIWEIDIALPAWVQLLLASIVQFGVGKRFYLGAWKSLRGGAGNMDVLVALGTSAAYGLSAWTVFSGGHAHDLYFEGAAMVITLVLLGKTLEARAKRGTSEAIDALSRYRTESAAIERDGQVQVVPISSLFIGDVILIRPGELVPVDGEIVEGASHLNESLITGESMPVGKEIGDKVTGGTMNGEGLLRVRVEAVGAEAKLAHIISFVEAALSSKAPVQKLVDKSSAIFVPTVVVIALAAFFWWLQTSDLERALIVAASVLVVACPCALGLATPAALIVGVGAAARDGILIRDAEALEIAHKTKIVVFDKTGTLTEGQPTVTAIHAADGDNNRLLLLTAAAQQGSEHPLAKAIVKMAETMGLTALPAVNDFTALPGKGLAASVEGRKLFIGNQRLVQEQGVDASAFTAIADKLEATGKTVIWIGEAGQGVLGLMALSDPIKPSARLAVERLKKMRVETIMLTGDNRRAAESVGIELGITRVIAEILPEEKAAEILRLKQTGKVVAMVGDGVNDAPALAAADIGIAMSTGTDVAMHTAGITLMRGDPSLIADAIIISRITHKKIRRNLFWAFIYNLIAIPLAFNGALTPMAAGAAMAMSSVSVAVSSLRLKKEYRKRKKKER